MSKRIDNNNDWIQLGDRIAFDGIAAHEPAVARLVLVARRRQINYTLVGILADPTEPEMARLRAFAKVTVALAAIEGALGHSDRWPRARRAS